jgi:hypothetical protein
VNIAGSRRCLSQPTTQAESILQSANAVRMFSEKQKDSRINIAFVRLVDKIILQFSQVQYKNNIAVWMKGQQK